MAIFQRRCAMTDRNMKGSAMFGRAGDNPLPYIITYLTVSILGFALCMLAYYPGLLSPDSLSIYNQARNFSFTDWHSPMMALLWALLFHVVPGPQGMLMILLTFYWGALLLLTDAAALIRAGLGNLHRTISGVSA